MRLGNVFVSHVCESVTMPCRLKNATGIVTEFSPFFFGSSVMRPKYCPFGSVGALIVIENLTVRFFFTWTFLFERPTVIVAPAGACVLTSSSCSWPETLRAVRHVLIEPVIVGASTLAMFRSMRCSGSAAEATKFAKVSSKTSVGSTARLTRIEPAPASNGSNGVTPSSFRTSCAADVMSADLISPASSSGAPP